MQKSQLKQESQFIIRGLKDSFIVLTAVIVSLLVLYSYYYF